VRGGRREAIAEILRVSGLASLSIGGQWCLGALVVRGSDLGALGALAVQCFQIGEDSGAVEAEEDAEGDRDGGAEPVL